MKVFNIMAYTPLIKLSLTTFRALAVVTALGCQMASVLANPLDATAGKPPTKNVILLIGDGMGLAHVSGAITASKSPLALEQSQIIGLTHTSSASSYVTDSAAAGTALASGQKTNNLMVGQTPSGQPLPSMLAYASAAGKSTGIVVTVTLTHATPAAFYAHNVSRRNDAEIALDLLPARLDVAIGGGRRHFERREDKQVLTDQFRAEGYTVAYTLDEVLAAPQGASLLGLLASGNMPQANEGRGPVLEQATVKALELLSSNPNGFILVVEGSQIDWGGHKNDWEYALAEIVDFDAAIKVAMAYADSNPDTLVVVTADHETGGLSLVNGNIRNNEITPHWATTHHTGIMVPVYAYGSNAQAFSGIYQNTDIFHRILSVLKLNDIRPEIQKK